MVRFGLAVTLFRRSSFSEKRRKSLDKPYVFTIKFHYTNQKRELQERKFFHSKTTLKGISTDSETSQREGVALARKRIGAAERPLCGGFGTCPGVLCETARVGKAQRRLALAA